MTVYLLHFDKPLKHAQHYIGWCKDDTADRRFATHLKGRGSALVRAAIQQGIGVTLVRQWEGKPRTFERQLKNRKNARRLCPCCKGK